VQKNQKHLIRESKQLHYNDPSWARRHHIALRENLGALRDLADLTPAVTEALRRASWTILSVAVVTFMTDYAPKIDKAMWERIGPFVRDAVSIAAPMTPYSAEVLIRAASHFVSWCMRQGWPLDAETVWARQSIDLYVNDKRLRLADGTRRNYRSYLMRISEILLPEEHGEKMTALNRKTTAAPYTAEEMTEFRHWAVAQRTPLKVYRCMLMLTLCAGAGLRPCELVGVRAEDVNVTTDGGFVIRVLGDLERSVPLHREWDEWMTATLERFPVGQETLWGTPNRVRPTAVLSAFTQLTDGDAPTGARLRATWLVTHLRAIANIKSLFTAGGFEKFEHLGRLLHYVSDVPDDDYIDFLRGEVEL
jgi:integrase